MRDSDVHCTPLSHITPYKRKIVEVHFSTSYGKAIGEAHVWTSLAMPKSDMRRAKLKA